jgi:cholinesterase
MAIGIFAKISIGLSGGSTDNAFYNGINLATAEDLIVVTINYRLNIFGFPGMPSMAQPNLGLLDVRLALEWVRDNIANFGGDNNKIVFSGQSSGAAWADQMIYAFADDPIFSGIISASGTALSFSPLPPTTAAANWETVVGVVGCSSTNQTAVLQCMQSVDTDTLEAAAGAVKGLSTSNVLRSTPAFYLVVDNATIFTAAGYAAMNANGDFAQVPSLLTHNNFEAGFYQVQLFAVTGTLPTQDQLTSFQLSTFTCADSVQAQARRQHNVPTWVYRYFGDWSNTRLYNTSGAYHGSDMEEIFGNSGNVSGIAPIAPQLSLGSIMQEAWGAFCADPVNGLTEQLGWPVYNEDKATMVLLGQNDQPEFTFVPPSTFDSPCSTVTLGISATATAT